MGDAAPAIIAIAIALVLVGTLSAAITALSIRYAHRRGMLDHPGARRLHSTPTPRGGGIGIVVAAVVACTFERLIHVDAQSSGLIAAILLVAAAGWIDDHRGLGVLPRLALHVAAAGTFLLTSFGDAGSAFGIQDPAVLAGLFAIVLLGCVWSINLHNFMDGINGLLATQAVFVFVVLAWLCATTLHGSAHAALLILWAAATLAFIPFNFPRARVFMGDVGSGVLGLLIAVGVLWQMQVPETAATSGLIACSAFVTDASCTLVLRMLRGKRWYSAHREHLYQWMTRIGMPHARVVAWYMGWNLAIVVPVLWWLNRASHTGLAYHHGVVVEGSELAAAAGVYALGAAAWVFGKRWCLDKVKSAGHA